MVIFIEKYDQMVLTNKERNIEKEERAIRYIEKMLKDEQRLNICELVRKTGCSRGFFYTNVRVREVLNRAEKEQKDNPPVDKSAIAMNVILEKQLEVMTKKMKELKKDNDMLNKKNEILKRESNNIIIKSIKDI